MVQAGLVAVFMSFTPVLMLLLSPVGEKGTKQGNVRFCHMDTGKEVPVSPGIFQGCIVMLLGVALEPE